MGVRKYRARFLFYAQAQRNVCGQWGFNPNWNIVIMLFEAPLTPYVPRGLSIEEKSRSAFAHPHAPIFYC